MDAVKLIKEAMRMCATYRKNCMKCPVVDISMKKYHGSCTEFKEKDPERYVETVEKWSAEHPPKTRQSEFLKLFPDACIEDGMIQIAPCMIDQNKYPKVDCIKKYNCEACCRDYWLQEVE